MTITLSTDSSYALQINDNGIVMASLNTSVLRFLFLFFACYTPFLEAQHINESEETITVTGTRTPKLLSETPVALDIVTGAEIESITFGTLEDALDYIPGINFTRSQKEGYNIQMQGFGSDHVLVLVDGQRLVSPTGSSVNLAQISALNIERIEIVRGAASALYGSEAMGGVINILTKDGFEHALRLTLEAGEYSDNVIDELEQEQSLSGSTYYKNLAVQVYQQNISSPAFNPISELQADTEGEKEKTLRNIRFLYKNNEQRMRASYRYQKLDELIQRSQGLFPGLGIEYYYATDVEQTLHSGLFSYKDLELKAQINNHDEISGLDTTKRAASIDLIEFDGQYIWNVLSAEWVGGFHYYKDRLDQINLTTGVSEVDNQQQSGIEGFLQGDWKLTEKFEVIAGFRVQNDDGYGQHSAFKLNTMYDFGLKGNANLKWRSYIGEGYRVPDIKQQWYVFDHSNLGYKVYGAYIADPDTEFLPETSINAGTNLEYSKDFSEDIAFNSSLNVYHSKNESFILTARDAILSAEENLDISVYKNIEESEFSGVDFDIELILKNQKYQITYNYLDARDTIENRRLEDRPYHQLKGNITYTIPSIDLSILSYFVYQAGEAIPEELSTVVNDEYATFNLSIDHQMSSHFRWRVGVENMFNEHEKYDLVEAEEFDTRPGRGRYLFLTLEAKLSR